MRAGCLLGIVFLLWASGMSYGQDDQVVGDGEAENVNEENTAIESSHALVSPADLHPTKDYQAEPMPMREFDKEKWKEIVGDVNYDEEKEAPPQKEESESEFESPKLPWAGPLLRGMSYVAVAALIIALVYLVVRNFSFALRIRRTAIEDDDLAMPVENIDAIDVESALEKAIREGNFKLAVRLYYLGLLKKLNETGVIAWKKDKTNRDYLSELFARDYFFDDIRKLTLSYERVWYGEHDLKGESFEALSARFKNVYARINPGEKGG